MTIQKQIVATITAGSNQSGLPEMVISSPTLDRERDRIIPTGGRFNNFSKNPVLLWGHQHSQLPIGTVTQLNVRDKNIKARWKWLDNDEFAQRVKHCWDEGVCRAASIGFMPLRTVQNQEGGFDFVEWDLLELSLVTVPANPEAVRNLKSANESEDSNDIIEVDPDELRDVTSEVMEQRLMQVTGRIPDQPKGRSK